MRAAFTPVALVLFINTINIIVLLFTKLLWSHYEAVSYTHLVVRRYSYFEKSETLKVPEELPVPKRVVDEEGEAEEEKRKNFCGSIQEPENTSVNTELQNEDVYKRQV